MARAISPPRSLNRYRAAEGFRLGTIHIILIVFSLACLLPLALVISASFSDEKDIALHGYSFVPLHFTTFAYNYILQQPEQLLRSYAVTVFVTAVGTALGLFFMSLLAYVLSRPDFRYRKQLSFYVFFTMLFNGGLVPSYILITQYLHLKDSILALILPYLIVPWYVLLLRTFLSQLPNELLDAARIDGAGEWRIFFQIVTPLAKPALATVGLFCILMYWNDWWLALLYIDNRALQPLQYLLYSILTNIAVLASSPQTTGIPTPVATVRMAMAVLATGPAALAFMLVQRYFVRGITIGALK
jgi:putative aldouronate transport system permease protein